MLSRTHVIRTSIFSILLPEIKCLALLKPSAALTLFNSKVLAIDAFTCSNRPSSLKFIKIIL